MDSLQPISDRSGEADACKEIAGQLVVSSSDTPPVLETAEGTFDQVALAISDRVKWRWSETMRHGRNHRDRALRREKAAKIVCVHCPVANQRCGRGHGGEKGARAVDVVGVAWRQQQRVKATLAVGEGVDLRRAATARASDGLCLLPPFAPLAERWARTKVLSIIATSGGSSHAAKAANISCHRPRLLQRLNRLKTVVRGPYSAGSARQRRPSRYRCKIYH